MRFAVSVPPLFFPPGFLGLQKSWLRTSTAAMRGEFLHLCTFELRCFQTTSELRSLSGETAYAARVSLKRHHGERSRSQGY